MSAHYVRQPNDHGCTIACLAMVAGMSYDEMALWLDGEGLADKLRGRGLYDAVYFEALFRLGFLLFQMYRFDPIRQAERSPWPPVPFAPVHIAQVDVAAGVHAVVVLPDGRVLDPWKEERTSLAHLDYLAVSHVTGIWRRP